MRPRNGLVLVFFLALALRVGVVLVMNASPYWRGYIWAGDSNLYDQIALDILGGSFYPPSPPHDYALERVPPIFPLYLSVVYGLLGHGALQVGLANAAVGALTAVVVQKLGTLAFGARTGLVAGLIMAVFPIQLFNTSYVLKETLLVGVLCMAVFAAAKVGTGGSLRWAAWGGLGMGLSTLGRYEEGGLVPLMGVWLLLLPTSLNRRLRTLAVFGLVYGLTLLPWVAHNYANYQRIFLFPSQPLAYLYNGNAPGLVGETSGYFEARGIQKPPEVQQDGKWWEVNEGAAIQVLVRRITDDVPGTFRLFWTKLLNMWRPTWEDASTANLIVLGGTYVLMMLFAIPAIFLAPRSSTTTLLRVVILFFFLFHLAFFGMIRQRQYVEPYLIVFAAGGVLWALTSIPSIPYFPSRLREWLASSVVERESSIAATRRSVER